MYDTVPLLLWSTESNRCSDSVSSDCLIIMEHLELLQWDIFTLPNCEDMLMIICLWHCDCAVLHTLRTERLTVGE